MWHLWRPSHDVLDCSQPILMRIPERALFGGMICTLLLACGCNDDLGECDRAAAQEVVYGRGGLVATKGQALVHDSCGNAAFCHSTAAKGSARYGAPLGLSFDMLPTPTGWPEIIKHRDDVWQLVHDESMPPAGMGEKVVGDGDWTFDVQRREDAPKLPPIASHEGKAVVRNWLACGAPLVADTQVPSWLQAGDDQVADDEDGGIVMASDWTTIYSQIVRPNCATAGCHNETGAGQLVMSEECSAYGQLLKAGACGDPRLEPGKLDSLLLEKLESRMPTCGTGMPPAAPLPAKLIAQISAWVEAGAQAPGCD